MKRAVILRSWMEGYGFRLDCQPYLGGALETKVLLDKLACRKDPLRSVTQAIYHAGRESRCWVDSLEHGVPFLSSSDILKADLSDLPLMARRQVAETPLFVIRRGWTLITRSGTIGKMAYCRPEMDGMACSEHVLRVVPDSAKVPSGYLYAFLSSKFGVPLVVSGTYGSIIQSIEPEHIANLPVPRFGDALEHEVHTLVEQAAQLRSQASAIINDARNRIVEFFGRPPTPGVGKRHPKWPGHVVQSGQLRDVGRLDALFYNPVASDLDAWVLAHGAGSATLGAVADVFDVPPFKHIYVEPEHGVGFFTSADIFLVDKKPDKFLSLTQTKGRDLYVLRRGWVLLARSGSLGGNIAKPQFADSAMDRKTASDHVIRIAPKTADISPGYLYAYLSTPEIGYPFILRTATGACIPALWPVYLKQIRVLQPSPDLNTRTDTEIQDAFEMRVRSTGLEDGARHLIEDAIEGGGEWRR